LEERGEGNFAAKIRKDPSKVRNRKNWDRVHNMQRTSPYPRLLLTLDRADHACRLGYAPKYCFRRPLGKAR
jgi:hypothetical protein